MPYRKLLHWFRQIDIWLLWPALALVIWGELAPSAGEALPYWDKALHFTAYFGLSLMATIAVKADRRALWGVVALIVLGGTLEIIQRLVGRDAELLDEVANTLGVVTGWALGWAGVTLLKARKLVEDEKPD